MLALLAPVLIWPWVPQWDIHPHNDFPNTIALFTLIPIAEEILFRGWLQGWLLKRKWFTLLTIRVSRANLFTSLVFAGAHMWQHALILVPGYFFVSVVLGHFRERYRGIAVPVLLHGYYNLGLLIASV